MKRKAYPGVMTDRELYLRHELSNFKDNLETMLSLTPHQRKKYAPCYTPEWVQECFNYILKRAFDDWDNLCNDNCKSMYFCEKTKNHKGVHGCCKVNENKYGLTWPKSNKLI